MSTIAPHPELTSTRERVRHYLGDLVYGANDGIITTFAIMAGVAGADLPAVIVVILGFANLVADGFSMGASNFLALRSRAAVDRNENGAAAEPFALRHGIATFAAFVVVGAVPLISFVLPLTDDRFLQATVGTLAVLFVVGASRSFVTGGRWWTEGAEMLAVGAAAAGVAFWIGRAVAAAVGVGG